MIITIDGPTASGKSSIAQLLAEKLNFYCLSSGALYRVLAYGLIHQHGYRAERLQNPDKEDVEQVLAPGHCCCTLDKRGCGIITIGGNDVTSLLKSPEISQAASIIGTNAFVREKLTALQRTLVDGNNVVLEGRDAGSVVFPAAAVKFFLTASVAVRAQRWQQLQKIRGTVLSEQEALREVQERDERDASRKHAPLIIPQDAIVIDNSGLTKEETVALMASSINLLV